MTIQSLIDNIIEKNAIGVQETFNSLLAERIATKLENKKRVVAQAMFTEGSGEDLDEAVNPKSREKSISEEDDPLENVKFHLNDADHERLIKYHTKQLKFVTKKGYPHSIDYHKGAIEASKAALLKSKSDKNSLTENSININPHGNIKHYKDMVDHSMFTEGSGDVDSQLAYHKKMFNYHTDKHLHHAALSDEEEKGTQHVNKHFNKAMEHKNTAKIHQNTYNKIKDKTSAKLEHTPDPKFIKQMIDHHQDRSNHYSALAREDDGDSPAAEKYYWKSEDHKEAAKEYQDTLKKLKRNKDN